MRTRSRHSLVTGAIISAVLAASLLTSGGSAFGSSAAGQRAQAHHHAAMTQVTFILNWLPNVEFAGIWVAQKFGWFKQAGINMKFIPWSSSVHPETDVVSRGGNSFGFQSGAAIAIAAAQNVPITALYTDTQKSVFGLTVLNKSGINKITDLRGKRIGYQSHEIYVPETMLSFAGLKPSDYKLVPVGFDISGLTAGQVDAWLTFQTNEPIALSMQGVGNHSFKAADYGFHFYDDVLLTTKSLIQKNPVLVGKVTQLVARGFKWAHSHPILAARLTVNNYFHASTAGPGVSAANNLRQQILELQKFKQFSEDTKGRFTGLMSKSVWKASINTLFKYGEIKRKPSATAIFTNTFNPYRNGNYH
jgi:ABC-type nitrate/sulfonate/bicarbonate transport system substrate-binding protein